MKVVISIILTIIVTSGWWFVATTPVVPKELALLAFWGIGVLILLTFINIIIFVIEAINEWNK